MISGDDESGSTGLVKVEICCRRVLVIPRIKSREVFVYHHSALWGRGCDNSDLVNLSSDWLA